MAVKSYPDQCYIKTETEMTEKHSTMTSTVICTKSHAQHKYFTYAWN